MGEIIQAEEEGYDESKLLLAFIAIGAILEAVMGAEQIRASIYFIADSVSTFNKQAINEQFTKALGFPIVPETEVALSEHLSLFVEENVSIVGTITNLEELRRQVLQGIRNGLSKEEIESNILRSSLVDKSKAARIARDQIGKLDGSLTNKRQRSAGIKQYVWSTSLDEKVRPIHAGLEGSIQDWGKPPFVGRIGNAHPGGDYNCRCRAQPVVPKDAQVTLSKR